jgi:hypothetical protein
MSVDRSFVDGHSFIAGSPFRSAYFLAASIVGLALVVTDAYLVYRHWQTTPIGVGLTLGILIGIQSLYQWWRILRYREKIRSLCSKGQDKDAAEANSIPESVRVATGGMIDALFFSYGITLVSLILIGFLLTRLDGRQ